ncbi:MAG TPA: HlyD family efflux transporter periplasmic adaptor subunit [Gemmataceae bacterium]|nr:HlyD family efflux transporter periplasmic adaptor subunit [Gemmataceae bacterium]
MTPRPIYRKEALDRLSSPEQLDQLMQVTHPRAWIALAAVGVVLLTALLWSLFGSIPITVETQGVLVRSGGVTTLKAKAAGQVSNIAVRSGDEVQANELLLSLAPETPGGAPVAVLSPFAARVLQRTVGEHDAVKAGDPLMVLEPLEAPLRAHLFVSAADGYQIQRDMKVRVWPAQVNRSEYGYLEGKVLWAVKFPVTEAEIQRDVQNADLAHQLAGAGSVLEVGVELIEDKQTSSGYRWSSARGAPVQLFSGMPCQASVVLGEERPIAYVFPGLGGRRGP